MVKLGNWLLPTLLCLICGIAVAVSGCRDGIPTVPLSTPLNPEFVHEWGGFDFSSLEPYCIEIEGETMHVLEHGQVSRYTLGGEKIDSWDLMQGGGGNFWPSDMARGDDGTFYITGDSRYVKVFTPAGVFLREWRVGEPSADINNQVEGIDLDAAGNIYVVDVANRRVNKYSNGGELLHTWGEAVGDFNGLSFTRFLRVLEDQTILLTDFNEGILQFSTNGEYLGRWPGNVQHPSELLQLHDGTILVSDTSQRIHLFTAEGVKLNEWGLDENGDRHLVSCDALAEDGSGNLYLGDSYLQRVVTFDRNGVFLGDWGAVSTPGKFKRVTAVAATDDGLVYTLDGFAGRVKVFDQAGSLLKEWGGRGERRGYHSFPTDIAVDAQGNCYVADSGNQRIVKYDGNGEVLRAWPSVVHRIAIGPGEVLYGASETVIRKMNLNGDLLSQWNLDATEEVNIRGIAVGSTGSVFAVDGGGKKVHVFDPEGKELASWMVLGADETPVRSVMSLAIDRGGQVVISNRHTNRVDFYEPDGTHLGAWEGAEDEQPGIFHGPADVDVDHQGGIWVADFFEYRILHYSPVEY